MREMHTHTHLCTCWTPLKWLSTLKTPDFIWILRRHLKFRWFMAPLRRSHSHLIFHWINCFLPFIFFFSAAGRQKTKEKRFLWLLLFVCVCERETHNNYWYEAAPPIWTLIKSCFQCDIVLFRVEDERRGCKQGWDTEGVRSVALPPGQ